MRMRFYGKWEKRIKAGVIYYSSARILEDGLYLDGEDIYYSKKGKREFICNEGELQIIGRHNYENVMAAAAIAISMGIPDGIHSFRIG